MQGCHPHDISILFSGLPKNPDGPGGDSRHSGPTLGVQVQLLWQTVSLAWGARRLAWEP